MAPGRIGKVLIRLRAGIVLALATLLAVVLYRPYLADWLPPARKGLPGTGASAFGERVLIVAPHPDDEALGGAGVILKARAAGSRVRVVVMTSGDGFKMAAAENSRVAAPTPADYRRLGEARHQESLAAMAHLGLSSGDILFLGYPDGGLSRLWETNWDENCPYTGLNGSRQSPYPFSYQQEAVYCGAGVVQNLAAILRDFNPTDVVYPDPNDQNHDHLATSAFVKYTLAEQNFKTKEWTYLVHRGDFPWPWKYDPNLSLHPPRALEGLDTRWHYLPLDDREKGLKLEAVKKYVTQVRVIAPFLMAFIRTNELFGSFTDPVLPGDEGSGAGNPPPILFLDPVEDTVGRELESGADLVGVGAAQAADHFTIGLATREAINPRIQYALQMRIFRPEGVQRLDLTVTGTRVKARKEAANSLDLPAGTRLEVRGKRLWLSMPAGVAAGATGILMSATAGSGDRIIDRAAWRLVRTLYKSGP
ncbi:PIG-L family deacetylase [Moorella naiadis]|uniref:PIG-L deacetylase family protein n=1 Tax=Moorella naiadis (nom. illeg.) TaxID=3093670 RepID=UPI003D9C8126